jgi:hypothetical protein
MHEGGGVTGREPFHIRDAPARQHALDPMSRRGDARAGVATFCDEDDRRIGTVAVARGEDLLDAGRVGARERESAREKRHQPHRPGNAEHYDGQPHRDDKQAVAETEGSQASDEDS